MLENALGLPDCATQAGVFAYGATFSALTVFRSRNAITIHPINAANNNMETTSNGNA